MSALAMMYLCEYYLCRRAAAKEKAAAVASLITQEPGVVEGAPLVNAEPDALFRRIKKVHTCMNLLAGNDAADEEDEEDQEYEE